MFFSKNIGSCAYADTVQQTLQHNLDTSYLLFQLTWADIAVGAFLDPEGLSARLKTLDVRAVAPSLVAHATKVNETPQIKKWREERPPSER